MSQCWLGTQQSLSFARFTSERARPADSGARQQPLGLFPLLTGLPAARSCPTAGRVPGGTGREPRTRTQGAGAEFGAWLPAEAGGSYGPVGERRSRTGTCPARGDKVGAPPALLGTLGSSEELVPVEGEPGALCEEPGQWRGLLPAQTKAWLCSVFVQLLYKSQQEIACSEGLQPRQGGSLAPSRHKPRRASSPLPHGPSTLQFAAWGGFEQLKMEAARGTRAKCPLETCLPRLQLQLAITPTELFRSAGRNTPVPAYPAPQPSLCTPACPRGAAPCNLLHLLSSARPGARPSPSALPRCESG